MTTRQLSTADTVNEQLMLDTVRHIIQFQRMSRTESRRLGAQTQVLLETLNRRLDRRLARIRSRGFDRGPWTTRQLEALIAQMSAIVDAAFVRIRGNAGQLLDEIAVVESDVVRRSIADSLPLRIDLNKPSTRQLRNIWRQVPMRGGGTMRDQFKRLATSTKVGIESAITDGLLRGDSRSQIQRGVRRVYPTARRHVETITRTAMAHVQSGAREMVFAENDDVVKGVVWVSTLDLRTSHVCIDLDGTVFPIDDGQRPPAHPRCRSSMAPYLRDAREVFGKKAKQLDAPTRASMNGQVPSTVNAVDFLRRQSAADQNRQLGVGIAKLFRAGKIEKFTDDLLQPLTLAQHVARLE